MIDLILLQERISGRNKLEQIRSKIDTIDQQLLLLLAQRHRLIGKVSGIKKEQKLGIEDVRRENDLVQNWSEMAEALGLPKKYGGQILETVLRFSKQHQKDSAE
ncbi:MAG: chorismate mutase [Calditrichia bacterium]